MLWSLLTQTQMLHSVAPPRIDTRSLRRLRSRNPFQMPFPLELSYHIMTDPHWLASKLVIWPGLWTSGLQCLKELIQHWLCGFVKLTDYGPFWPSIRPRLSPSRADVAEKLIDVWNYRREHISPWDDSGRNYPQKLYQIHPNISGWWEYLHEPPIISGESTVVLWIFP